MSSKRARKEDAAPAAAGPSVADRVAVIEADLRQFHELDDQKWAASANAAMAVCMQGHRNDQRITKVIDDMNVNTVQTAQRILKERREVDAAHKATEDKLATMIECFRLETEAKRADGVSDRQEVGKLEHRVTELDAANKALLARVDLLVSGCRLLAHRVSILEPVDMVGNGNSHEEETNAVLDRAAS